MRSAIGRENQIMSSLQICSAYKRTDYCLLLSALLETAFQTANGFLASQMFVASQSSLCSLMCPTCDASTLTCRAISLQPTHLTTASWASWWSSTSTPATSSTSTTSRGRTSRWFTARWTTSGRYVGPSDFKSQTSSGNLLVARCRSSDPAYRPLGPLFNMFKFTPTLRHFFFFGGQEVDGGGLLQPATKHQPETCWVFAYCLACRRGSGLAPHFLPSSWGIYLLIFSRAPRVAADSETEKLGENRT